MKNIRSSKNDPTYTSKKHFEGYDGLASEMSASTIDGDYSTPDCSGGIKFFWATKKLVRETNIKKRESYLEEVRKTREVNLFQGNGTNEFKINIWPHPSHIVVGIKFVNIFSGKFLFRISNTQVRQFQCRFSMMVFR